jgi:Ni/Fe-hydrogenase subunit HybB-like protein
MPLALTPPRRRFFTPGVWLVTAIAVLGGAVLLYRFAFGLDSATNLTNRYPWGIWIAIDVACGVALAAGGFTTAFLAHVVHREEFHPVVRPALLTAMIGYTFVAMGVATDLGRFWAIWHVMLPSMWQGNSVLFEVAICVMTYLTVLYIEFLPVVCERFIGRVRLPGPLARFNVPVDRLLRVLESGLGRVMTVFIILGVLLSCMHQSSLGTLMVVSGPKLHPLWQTPMLPALFLLSAFSVGFPMVIFESLLASRSFGLPPERRVLSRLACYIPLLLGVYFAAKMIDLANRGAFGLLIEGSLESNIFLVEVGLGVVIPFFIFLSSRLRASTGWLMTGASLVILGVVLNRLNVFLIGYTPAYDGEPYVPAWTEVAITAGFIAMIVLLYRFFALNFPVIEQLGEEEQ